MSGGVLKAKFWAVGVACFLLFCVAPASALAGSISGTVTEADSGLPMDEVTVCADAIGLPGLCVGVPESGEYTLEGLETGEYRVSFQPNFESNYVRQYYPGTLYYEGATLVSVDSSEAVTGIDAAIEEGAILSGTVVGEGVDGPLEEIEACAREIGGAGYEFCGWTDSAGAYRVPGVPPGHYDIVFENEASGVEYATRYYDEKSFVAEADQVELESGQEFTADATMSRAGAIEGIATEDGHPLEFDFVCAYTPAEVEVNCTVTEEDGSYRLEGLPVGSYILELEDFGVPLQFSGGAETFEEATPVTVEAEETTIENFEIAGPPGISGTVLDAATGEPPEGPVSACASSEAGTTCFQIESDGTYELIGLEPGEYLIYFESGIGGYIRQYYDGVSDEADATLVTIGETMITGIDAELQQAGMITGHITLSGAGTNLGTVNACAFNSSGVLVECNSSSSSTGKYTIRELPPGEYKVRFTKSGYGTQYYNGKATLAEAEPLTVTAGGTNTGVDVAMVKLVRPANTSPPEMTGVGKVGETLSCTQGVWANGPTGFEFYWFRNGREIHGAEASTYQLVTADAGTKIKCGVLAENGAGRSNVIENTTSLTVAAIRQLTVTTAGSGSGIVRSLPLGIECGADCDMSANEGEAVMLSAFPTAHSEFTGWSGEGCSGTGACEVTLGSANANVTATFAPITHPVSVAVTGAGSVSADSGAISGCTETEGTCSGTYEETAELTLTATPAAHHTFTGWTGCTTESGDECQVTVEAAEDVTATFAPIVHQLSVAKSGDGSGTVTSSPAGIECGALCAAGLEEGTTVTLTAVASSGSEFTGWSGDCSGTGSCVVTLAVDTNVVAGFAAKPTDGGGNGGASDGGSNQQSPPSSSGSTDSPPAAPPAPPPKHVNKKPPQCKKGFRKAKKNGKTRCVKAKPKATGKKGKRKN
jgi:carboxypeptidase family protein/List-Bact-rpt repeat protein